MVLRLSSISKVGSKECMGVGFRERERFKGKALIFGIEQWGCERKSLDTFYEMCGDQGLVIGERRVSNTCAIGTSG